METNGLNVKALLACMAYRGLNQKDLAEAIELSRVTMNRIMQGKVLPNLETIQKISEALDMSPEQFTEVFMNTQRRK